MFHCLALVHVGARAVARFGGGGPGVSWDGLAIVTRCTRAQDEDELPLLPDDEESPTTLETAPPAIFWPTPVEWWPWWWCCCWCRLLLL